MLLASDSVCEQSFCGSFIHDNPGEPVLSQMRDLLEQPLDFYEPDVLSATQTIVSKHYYRKNPVVSSSLFYRHAVSIPCLINSVKVSVCCKLVISCVLLWYRIESPCSGKQCISPQPVNLMKPSYENSTTDSTDFASLPVLTEVRIRTVLMWNIQCYLSVMIMEVNNIV